MERPLSLFAKLVLIGAGGLAVIVGPVLYLFPFDTAIYFAWEIKHPLTPMYMGAAYLAGLGNFFALYANRWSLARVQLPAIIAFATAMLVATLLHIPAFNWAHPIAWAWLAVYIVSPPAATLLLVIEERRYRPPAASGPRLPSYFGAVMYLFATISAIAGIALLLFPAQSAPLWAWTLTPLTARVVGGWILGGSALQWMLARQQTLATAWVGIVATVLITVLALVAAVWRSDYLNGPLLGTLFYLGYHLLLCVVSLIAWRQAASSNVPSTVPSHYRLDEG